MSLQNLDLNKNFNERMLSVCGYVLEKERSNFEQSLLKLTPDDISDPYVEDALREYRKEQSDDNLMLLAMQLRGDDLFTQMSYLMIGAKCSKLGKARRNWSNEVLWERSSSILTAMKEDEDFGQLLIMKGFPGMFGLDDLQLAKTFGIELEMNQFDSDKKLMELCDVRPSRHQKESGFNAGVEHNAKERFNLAVKEYDIERVFEMMYLQDESAQEKNWIANKWWDVDNGESVIAFGRGYPYSYAVAHAILATRLNSAGKRIEHIVEKVRRGITNEIMLVDRLPTFPEHATFGINPEEEIGLDAMILPTDKEWRKSYEYLQAFKDKSYDESNRNKWMNLNGGLDALLIRPPLNKDMVKYAHGQATCRAEKFGDPIDKYLKERNYKSTLDILYS